MSKSPTLSGLQLRILHRAHTQVTWVLVTNTARENLPFPKPQHGLEGSKAPMLVPVAAATDATTPMASSNIKFTLLDLVDSGRQMSKISLAGLSQGVSRQGAFWRVWG